MNTNCAVCFDIRALIVSRTFLKKASIPFTEEYDMLTRLTKQHPDFTLQVKAAAPRKPQFMPSYKKMVEYIRFQENANELMDQFDMVRMMADIQTNPYMYVRSWFLTKFPELENAA